MYARYAIYFAPHDQSALAQFGHAILGRTATAQRATDASSSFVDNKRWQLLSAKPAHYGFHATLKAPFELAPGSQPADLLQACKQLAGQIEPVKLTGLAPRRLGRFAALVVPEQSAALQQLAHDCVVDLEQCRAPISDYDLQRKKNSSLSERQNQQLEQYGYPYIFDDFTFHMTLSGQLSENDEDYLQWLDQQYRQIVQQDPILDRIAIFAQSDRESAFTRVEEFCFL